MLRVLVVDDSPTARALLVDMIRRDDELTVIGEAGNGAEAVQMTARLAPDVITMDIHMPGISGFDATKQIMISHPTPIVIVSSSTTVDQVATSMRALRAGALTLVRKPAGPGSGNYDAECADLVATVKLMADVKVVRHLSQVPAPAIEQPASGGSSDLSWTAPPDETPPPPAVVAIAASTGGPPAIQQVLAGLPNDFPLPILCVQHIAKGFTEGFAEWLNVTVPPRVTTAQRGELLAAGSVYVAPEDGHLGVSRSGRIEISESPPLGGFRPSASYLFESAANAFGRDTLAVIMTGMGEDGVAGLRRVRECQGTVIAQDRATSVIFGMPGAAVRANVVDETLAVQQIAERIQRFARQRSHR